MCEWEVKTDFEWEGSVTLPRQLACVSFLALPSTRGIGYSFLSVRHPIMADSLYFVTVYFYVDSGK